MKKHLLICGDIGVGKSTLIQKLLAHKGMPVYGYITKRVENDETGFHPIYIHPASQPFEDREYRDDNCIGYCNGKSRRIALDVFNQEGVRLLQSSREDGIIVMDEIGFMEVEAVDFVQAIMDVLDGDIPAIAAVKSRKDIPLLDQIRNHPNAMVYWITQENRDALYEQILKEYFGE